MEGYNTAKYFNLFRKEGEYWAIRYGLVSWDISFEIDNESDDDQLIGARAICYIDKVGRGATMVLNEDWDVEPTNELVCRCAFHETTHIPLSEIKYDYVPDIFIEDIRKGEESVVRMLETVLFKPDYNSRFTKKGKRRK